MLTALEFGDGMVLSSNITVTTIQVNGNNLKSWGKLRGLRLQAEVLPVNTALKPHQPTNFS